MMDTTQQVQGDMADANPMFRLYNAAALWAPAPCEFYKSLFIVLENICTCYNPPRLSAKWRFKPLCILI